MSDQEQIIFQKINAYKRKFFLNLALRGLIISIGSILGIFLVVNALEYSIHFNSVIRACLFVLLIGSTLALLGYYVFLPLYKFYTSNSSMEDDQAAIQIGSFFPNIHDKLLNIIQLSKSTTANQALAKAGILQKSTDIQSVDFNQAIPVKANKRYIPYLLVPFFILIVLLVFTPSLITSSTTRIVKFNETFEPEAPFDFNLINQELIGFKNEDYTVQLTLSGEAVPENAYLVQGDRKFKMYSDKNGQFEYTFKKIQSSRQLHFEAAGFSSSNFTVRVVERPALKTFNIYLDYPKYLDRKSDRLSNVGNLQVPQGTKIRWELSTLNTQELKLIFDNEKESPKAVSEDGIFAFEKIAQQSERYEIQIRNEFGQNKQPISFSLEVIPDEYPAISNSSYQDTTLFSFVALSGEISDDYGLSKLRLYYQYEEDKFKPVDIPIDTRSNAQRFYYQWALDSVLKDYGNEVQYYLQVWDNDGISGPKSSKTGLYKLKVPSDKEIKEQIDSQSQKTQRDINKTIEDAKELKEELEEAENRLKGKKELNWQDENLLKDILERREELNKAIEELKEQNRNTDQKRERFSPQNDKIKEKVEQLQELMTDLLDEETKKLYEELQKLLEEQRNIENIQDLLDRLNSKENNLEKELERTLELFKRMKFEHELNESINELSEQIEEQEELQEKTEDKKSDNAELAEEQEKLQEKFEELEENLDKLEEMNQDLQRPESMPDLQEEEQNIKDQQQQSKESLDQGKKKKSSESQQEAIDQMQQMQQQMQQMQSNSEISMTQENLDDLRDIVNNLLKLSFDQEDLMKEFAQVKQSDPRFVELAQVQLKLKDDAKIVEDSLLSLANRVFVLASFVTREVGEMNSHMDKSVEAIKERKKPLAVSEQQFTMTSMNNLALLLDDVMKQMQENLADAMGKPQKGQGKQKAPSLGKLQQQLNQQINELKESGKSGRQLSEELAKLAAEQQRIREALKEMQEKLNNGEGDGGNKPGDGLIEKMEETEIDLVNKQITEKTIQRQKDILTRLLEAEDALRERDKDEERKAETAKDYNKQVPEAFEEYFKLKQQEIELLKTIPPKLYPYYRKEVNDYFKRIGNDATN